MTVRTPPQPGFTLNDALIESVSRLVDDHDATRQPAIGTSSEFSRSPASRRAIPTQIPRCGWGKRKRVQQALRWALEHDEVAGAEAVARLIGVVRGCGGFRGGTSNYCGTDAIETCIASFSDQPVELAQDGALRPPLARRARGSGPHEGATVIRAARSEGPR